MRPAFFEGEAGFSIPGVYGHENEHVDAHAHAHGLWVGEASPSSA
jgi:hypothetical protein